MELTYKNIIVAVDGSNEADKAFRKALEIVKQHDARLIITHVIDSRSFTTVEAYDVTLGQRIEKQAKELLDDYTERAKENGIENLVKCLEYGSPKIRIPKDITKRFNADLIVCGATGLNAVERFLIGSVSENITRNAPCDVLVVR